MPRPPTPVCLTEPGEVTTVPTPVCPTETGEVTMALTPVCPTETGEVTVALTQLGSPEKVQGDQLAEYEAELSLWLNRTLEAERAALVQRLQLILKQRISNHHDALLEEVASQVTSTPSIAKSEASAEPASAPVTVEPELGERKYDKHDGPGELHRSDTKRYKSDFIAGLAAADQIQVVDLPLLRHVMSSCHFEIACSTLIILSIIVSAVEVQYSGCQLSGTLHFSNECVVNSEEEYQLTWNIFNYLAVAFTVLFFFEVALRISHIVRLWWSGIKSCSIWVAFDLVVLVLSVIDSVDRITKHMTLLVNPTIMRLARVARMLRIVKMFRTRIMFQTLFLLVKSILASRQTLLWFILILVFAMTSIGLLINQALFPFLADEAEDWASRREIYEYFGTYTRMMITMFELTLGNWAPPCRALMEEVSVWWGLIVCVYRCIFCFSLVNVTVACFITETGRVAADDQVQMMRKVRTDRKTAKTVVELFKEIDASGDGFMTLQELRTACEDKVMKDLLEMLDLEVRDIEELFDLMDGGGGKVKQDEFVDGIMRLRGEAKCSRQVAMFKLMKKLAGQVEAFYAEFKSEEAKALRRGKPQQRHEGHTHCPL